MLLNSGREGFIGRLQHNGQRHSQNVQQRIKQNTFTNFHICECSRVSTFVETHLSPHLWRLNVNFLLAFQNSTWLPKTRSRRHLQQAQSPDRPWSPSEARHPTLQTLCFSSFPSLHLDLLTDAFSATGLTDPE